MLSPRFTDVGPVFRIFRSRTGGVPTVVVTVEVSSPGVLSVGTLAVLVTVPVWVVLTLMKIGPKVCPTVRVPTLQVMEVTGFPFVTQAPVKMSTLSLHDALPIYVAFGYDTLPVLVILSP